MNEEYEIIEWEIIEWWNNLRPLNFSDADYFMNQGYTILPKSNFSDGYLIATKKKEKSSSPSQPIEK